MIGRHRPTVDQGASLALVSWIAVAAVFWILVAMLFVTGVL